MFYAKSINDVELIYSILVKKYNKNVDIQFDYNTQIYTLNVNHKSEYSSDPDIPLDFVIKVIYGDTDSIFVSMKFNRDNHDLNRKDAFKLGIICGDNITHKLFKRPPIVLEFEKVYQPFILLSKKRYIGRKYEDTRDPLKLKSLTTAGISVQRRDYCKMVKQCYTRIIECIMDTYNLDRSIDIFKQCIQDIDQYNIDIDDLVISATLAKNYTCSLCKEKTEWSRLMCSKKRCKFNNVCSRFENCPDCKTPFECLHQFSYAHVNLGLNMLVRQEDISVNERIQYLYVDKGHTDNHKKTNLAETPSYAKEHNIPFNRFCYLQQLAKPILGFYKVILDHEPEKLDELIKFVNTKLEIYGGEKLKASDYKLIAD